MEIIFEIILELVLDCGIEIGKSKHVPKYIRYPLVAIMALFVIFVIGVIVFEGIAVLKKNVAAGIFFLAVGAFLLISCIVYLRKAYLTKTDKK